MEPNRFYGSACISCGNKFAEGDDIVVCPECGTPYHRECYKKEGKCINTELHASGLSWKPLTEEEAARSETSVSGKIRCIRCGEENEPDGIFCIKCGLPLHENEPAERPFNDNYKSTQEGNYIPRQPDTSEGDIGQMRFGTTVTLDKNSEIDGITVDEYVCYIRNNPIYFIATFFKFFKLKTKVSFNFGAVIFPEFYMLYRKMYISGFIMLLVTFALSIPSYIYLGTHEFMGQIFIKSSSFVNGENFDMIYQASYYAFWAVRLLLGFTVNYFYYSKVKRSIRRIKAQNPDEKEARQIMAMSGGVSWPAVIVGFTVMFALFTALMMFMNTLA